MKKEITARDGKVIYYEEGFWSGKRKIKVNGVPLIKINKTTYSDGNNNIV